MEQAENFNSVPLNFYNIYTEETKVKQRLFGLDQSNIHLKKLGVREILMKDEKKLESW